MRKTQAKKTVEGHATSVRKVERNLKLVKSKIEINNLSAQRMRIQSEVEKRVMSVIESGQYILGPEVGELEKRLAEFVGVKHCISCANGTDALQLGLMALDVKPGDAVFTTPFTFFATAEVVSLVGATPVFVDVDPQTYNIDPERLREAIERVKHEGKIRPKGIITVDLFGLPADYDAIGTIARENSLFVMEDGAQSFGAEYKGRRAPGLADLGTTSFFPSKPLGCYGDGGAVFTDRDDLAGKLKSLRVHGKGEDKYDNVRIGVNSRLDTLQAAVLLSKFDVFPDEIVRRNRVAERYSRELSDVVTVPRVPEHLVSVWAQYSILTPQRDKLASALRAEGIATAVYYPKPLHLQTAYRDLQYAKGSLPVSERLSSVIISLPMYPYLTKEDQDRVIEAVRKSVK